MSNLRNVAKKIIHIPQNDHRNIGQRQKLFFFHKLSRGSCFFRPRGARIYNKLVEFIRNEYKQRNYLEVITPTIFDNDLWIKSGHWEHYKENLIKFKLNNQDFSLKPMNCPGHCVMYQNLGTVFAHNLPIRLAEFGVLHRNELSGSLMGLTRVRRFQQDDGHVFCTPQQIGSEVEDCLQFAEKVYRTFNFNFDIKLSLRPKNYLGSSDRWDEAEESLRQALKRTDMSFVEEKEEGAFYGPKIDLIVKDQLQRSHQCATIQLDFQLPERFGLKYHKTQEDSETPVMIHRAILGSFERFIAMVAENCRGRWPFWLSPLQAKVIPVTSDFDDYAIWVGQELRKRGFWVDADTKRGNMKTKIKDSFSIPYNLVLVVGSREAGTKSVNVRLAHLAGKKDDNPNVNVSLNELIDMMSNFESEHIDRADIELQKRLS